MPDLLAHVEGIGSREVIATDATYQSESAHYDPRYPKPDGGDDNQLDDVQRHTGDVNARAVGHKGQYGLFI